MRHTTACVLLCAGVIGLPSPRVFAQNCTNATYTTSADFAAGISKNLRVVDGLELEDTRLEVNEPPNMFPYVNVACTTRGTAVRILVGDSTTAPYVVGEYQTFPSSNREVENWLHGDPSRTTVDHLGNIWVANRGEWGLSGGVRKGAITRIALVEGGTRGKKINGQFVPDQPEDPPGEYLSPPFTYVSTVDGEWDSLDKDGDGLLRTSSGLGNILAWSNAGGVDTDGGGRPENERGVLTAEDELIMNYTRVAGTKARTMAIDFNNDLWCGGYGNHPTIWPSRGRRPRAGRPNAVLSKK